MLLSNLKIALVTKDRHLEICNFVECTSEIKDRNRVVIDLENNYKVEANVIITPYPEKYLDNSYIQNRITDVLVIDGKLLKTLITTHKLNNGISILSSRSGNVVGIYDLERIIITAKPLNLYLIHRPELLIEDIKILCNYILRKTQLFNDNLSKLAQAIINHIINERRSSKKSKIVNILENICSGRIEDYRKLPTSILDILEEMQISNNSFLLKKILCVVMNRVIEYVYPK